MKTNLRAGALSANHNEALVPEVSRVRSMQIKTGIKAGGSLGDLAGAEKHYAATMKFFDDPDYRRLMFPLVVTAFGCASMNAWMIGRISAARERNARMMANVNQNNPLELAASKQ